MFDEIKTILNKNIKSMSEVFIIMDEVKKIAKLEENELISYCEEKVFDYHTTSYRNILSILENISRLDLDKINTKIRLMLDEMKKELIESEWELYNAQYKNLFSQRMKNIEVHFENYNRFVNNSSPKIIFDNYLNGILSILNNLDSELNPNLDKLYSEFKYGNKNYIVFGKNGSGKTTLLNYIKNNFLNSNSFVIPANRKLNPNSNSLGYHERSLDLNNCMSNDKALDMLTLKAITKQYDELLDSHHKNEKFEGKTIIDRASEIFKSLNIERNFVIEKEDENIYLYGDDIAKYSLSNGSDGEKTVIYMILSILLLPENAFVFIDEPENHLNGSLMIELYNLLENERNDIKFIYFTHSIDFIESRNNVELLYLEKTKKFGEWDFKNIDQFKDIELDTILNIVGTKSNLLFCEGNNKSSIDYKIYSTIYDDYTIIPVESCLKVIEYTKTINENTEFTRRKASGIIDNDFKEEIEISELNSSKVYTLNYNELENIFLDEKIIIILNKLNLNKDCISKIKNKIFKFAEENKEKIINDFLNKQYKRIITSGKLKYDSRFEECVDALNAQNKDKIIKSVNILLENIEKFISEENYDELIRIIPGKMIIDFAAKELRFACKEDFITFFTMRIRTNQELKDLVKEKLPNVGI